jgi:hypothetical protein
METVYIPVRIIPLQSCSIDLHSNTFLRVSCTKCMKSVHIGLVMSVCRLDSSEKRYYHGCHRCLACHGCINFALVSMATILTLVNMVTMFTLVTIVTLITVVTIVSLLPWLPRQPLLPFLSCYIG